MKKIVYRALSLILMLAVIFSSTAMFSISAKELEADDFQWSRETPFIMYEDEEGIRYIGPTGNKEEEKTEDTQPAFADAKESIRTKGELAAVGSSVLPSFVDLSTSKYFPAIGNQGSLGSCATWATVYYQFTYEMNRMRGTAATPENTASPKFVYNLLSQRRTQVHLPRKTILFSKVRVYLPLQCFLTTKSI